MAKDYIQFNDYLFTYLVQYGAARLTDLISSRLDKDLPNRMRASGVRPQDNPYMSNVEENIKTTLTQGDTFVGVRKYLNLEDKPSYAFLGVYYEYGTGTKMQPPKGFAPGGSDWNPGRPVQLGAKIYTRPYGHWKDMGGNTHFSKNKHKPKPVNPKSLMAREVTPTRWFAKGMWNGYAMVHDKAVSELDLVMFMYGQDIFKVEPKMIEVVM